MHLGLNGVVFVFDTTSSYCLATVKKYLNPLPVI